MIFKSRRALEEEIQGRMMEAEFKRRTEEELWKLRDEVQQLKWRVDCLEGAGNSVKVGPTAGGASPSPTKGDGA